jgi:hypothetical protein
VAKECALPPGAIEAGGKKSGRKEPFLWRKNACSGSGRGSCRAVRARVYASASRSRQAL